eukprot:scpid104467/ scgid32465/ 
MLLCDAMMHKIMLHYHGKSATQYVGKVHTIMRAKNSLIHASVIQPYVQRAAYSAKRVIVLGEIKASGSLLCVDVPCHSLYPTVLWCVFIPTWIVSIRYYHDLSM